MTLPAPPTVSFSENYSTSQSFGAGVAGHPTVPSRSSLGYASSNLGNPLQDLTWTVRAFGQSFLKDESSSLTASGDISFASCNAAVLSALTPTSVCGSFLHSQFSTQLHTETTWELRTFQRLGPTLGDSDLTGAAALAPRAP